jgi:catechol 2,3-dioxygenase-like lactoylglutathione lyase family enzyme
MDSKTVRSWNFDAPDLDATVRFYQDVLGAKVRTEHQVRGVDVTRLELGGFSIGVFDAAAGENAGVPHHTIEIEGPDDPEVLKRQLQAKGLMVEGPRAHREPNGYSLYVNDPAGNRLELSKSGR